MKTFYSNIRLAGNVYAYENRVRIVCLIKHFVEPLFRESYIAYYVENGDPASTVLSNLYYSLL